MANLVKIMARFVDRHPDTLVDIVLAQDEWFALETWNEYLDAHPDNAEGYDSFYKETL